jgi:predicted GNAT superfamily acetyltransferase
LGINASSRPAVAALDAAELDRLLALSNHHLVAATAEGAVVAYLLAFDDGCAYDGEEFQYFLAQLRRPFFYADQIAVESGRIGSGLGRQLYETLLAHARARNVATLCCEVNTVPPNPASLHFHRRLGFTVMGIGDTLEGRRVAFLVRKV